MALSNRKISEIRAVENESIESAPCEFLEYTTLTISERKLFEILTSDGELTHIINMAEVE